MDTGKAVATISINIATFKSQVEQEWNFPTECSDFPSWIKVLDEHIQSEIRGLRVICFDNGDIASYPSYKERLEHEWKIAKRALLELINEKC